MAENNKVTASLANPKNNSLILQEPFRIFEAAHMLITLPFIFLYIAMAFFIALLTTIATSIPNDTNEKSDTYGRIPNTMHFPRETARREILRFVFISGILASVIGALIFSTVQVGANSPAGLVRQHMSNGNKTTHEWIINVGGIQDQSTRNYVGGIQIPSTVVIFGLLGGYLRYLYGLRYLYTTKTLSQDSKDVDPLWGDIDLSDPLWYFKHALRSLSLIFLASLLAVGIWFILFQGNFEGKFVISAISLTIGLITEEAVQSIIAFSRNILSGIRGTMPDVQKKNLLKVIAKSPYVGQLVNITPPLTITATFNNIINRKTVDYRSFYIKDTYHYDPKDIDPIKGITYDLSDDAKTVKCIINTPLERSKTYIVTITTEVKDTNGYSLGVPEIWSFKTEPVKESITNTS